MMLKFLPWKWLVRRASKKHNFVDPLVVLARLRQFAEPAEVAAPLELIRASIAFQARGMVNTQAIQHNLDWIWPYWVEKQFDPRDPSFVPRSFSLAHINMTHRNWMAVSLPDADQYALVDPCGLITPLHDGWSLDAWIVSEKQSLIPSRCNQVSQRLQCQGELAVQTKSRNAACEMTATAKMQREPDGTLAVKAAWVAEGPDDALLCVALRPYNPEGIQFIDAIQRGKDFPGWIVNRNTKVELHPSPSHYVASNYQNGDVFQHLSEDNAESEVECPVGMATAAAVFPIKPKDQTHISVKIPLAKGADAATHPVAGLRPRTTWSEMERSIPALQIPDSHMSYLFDTSMRTTLALSSGDVVPGSYTYRRFWFRDACLMLHALLTFNQEECFLRTFEHAFLPRQTRSGYFESQEGEWDSNGQVLWLAGRYVELFDTTLPPHILKSLRKAADWICRKRRGKHANPSYEGLLPAGFSAEHLGPNNFYFWDNFWSVAGLQAASALFRKAGDRSYADKMDQEAKDYQNTILQTIDTIPIERCRGAIPAAPNRRMDSGAVGSLAADYPLQILDPADTRIIKTVQYLLDHCMIENGFFHDMIHSGINPYLTLHIAQALLRAGDDRYRPLIQRIAQLASATGQWPEAVHPRTGGGCMGDGQHGWAAAEWALMIRGLFLREEKDHLVVCQGLFPEWLHTGQTLSFGPTMTHFGKVTIRVDVHLFKSNVTVTGRWHAKRPKVDLCMPAGKKASLKIEDIK